MSEQRLTLEVLAQRVGARPATVLALLSRLLLLEVVDLDREQRYGLCARRGTRGTRGTSRKATA